MSPSILEIISTGLARLRKLPAPICFTVYLFSCAGATAAWGRSAADLDEQVSRAESFNINAEDNRFELLGDFEGTTIIFKVYDSSGAIRGALKLPSAVSNYLGEIAAHKIARFLGITIFPATVYKTLDGATAIRLENILQAKVYNTKRKDHHKRGIENKEKNRLEALRRLKADETPDGCFKEWVKNIQFVSEIGTRKALGAHELMQYLKADGPRAPKGTMVLKQCTYLMSEKGCFTGTIEWSRLVQDMSDMMLVDALSGNLDRFPGGNIHMRSLDGRAQRTGKGVYYPRAELLALDNGATFMGDPARNLDDLTGRRLASIKVERFAKGRYEKLLELRELARKDPAGTRQRFFLRRFAHSSGVTIDMLAQFNANLEGVIDYMRLNSEQYGSRAVLP